MLISSRREKSAASNLLQLRHDRRNVGATLVAIFLGGIFLSSTIQAADKPNVLLILSDDHSLPHLGSYGETDAVTPNLDAFAAEGMRFDRAYTTAPQCAPSRASIFTGRSPIALGITRFTQPVPGRFPFFTDALREQGYYVGLSGRYHHLRGKKRGHPATMETLEEEGLIYLDERFDHFTDASTKGKNLASVPTLFEDFLDEVPEDSPFFLYFGFSQTHRSWPSENTEIDFDSEKLKLPFRFPDLPEVREDYRQFLLSLFELDQGFGILMQILKDRGLAEDTLVIFMGDNGEALLRGKGTLYEAGCKVPLIIRYPGVVEAGLNSQVLISGEDISATVLEAAGLRIPESMTGNSFFPELAGKTYNEREYVFTERGTHGSSLPFSTESLDLSRAITTKDYAFIYNALPGLPFAPVDMQKKPAWEAVQAAQKRGELKPVHEKMYFSLPRPMFELYDLNADPHQINNLADKDEFAELTKNFRIRLSQWMVRESDYLPLPLFELKN